MSTMNTVGRPTAPNQVQTKPATLTGGRGLLQNEPLIFEGEGWGKTGVDLPEPNVWDLLRHGWRLHEWCGLLPHRVHRALERVEGLGGLTAHQGAEGPRPDIGVHVGRVDANGAQVTVQPGLRL